VCRRDGDGVKDPEKESAWEGMQAPWKEMSSEEGPLRAMFFLYK
jgi:hypothetical protein